MSWFTMLALRRLRTQWQSLTTLIIGVLLAAIIGANTSLYNTAIAQVGMTQFLQSQDSGDRHLYSRTSQSPEEVTNFAQVWQNHDITFQTEFDKSFERDRWTGEPIQWAETQPLYPIINDQDIPNARVRIAYYQNLQEHTKIIEGNWLSDTTTLDAQIPVLIEDETATELNLSVGDIVTLDQRGWDSSQLFTAQIVGIFSVTDETSSYWFSPSPIRTEGSTTTATEVNLFTTRATISSQVTQFIPRPPIQMGWRVAFNHNALPYTEIVSAQQTLTQFEDNLSRAFLTDETAQGNFFYTTELPALFSEYQNDIVFLNVPFALLSLQLGALIFFFLILISALVRRGERREIAMLQSRGAQDSQILLLRGIEALIICGTTALIAPFIAQWLLIWFIPLFTGIQQPVTLQLTPQTFAYSGLAGLIALILLTSTLLPVLQLPLINAGGIGLRSQKQTWWQRYYLDVVLLIVGVAALYQLTNRQSLVTDAAGDIQADPLLLLAPSVLFIAFSSVLLRFFPLVMNIISRFFTSRRNVEGAIASWQVSREPLHYGRIAFLLALAIGIGWFAISYQATVVGNQTGQASYLVGSDIRIVYEDNNNPELINTHIETIQQNENVEASTAVRRLELRSMTAGGGRRSREPGTILAVNSAAIPTMLLWRDDLGDLQIPPNPPEVSQPIGKLIPDDATIVSIWARAKGKLFISFGNYTQELRIAPNTIRSGNVISARFIDANGTIHHVPFVPNTEALNTFFEDLIEQSDNPDEFNPYEAFDSDEDGTVDDIPDYDYPNDGWLRFDIDFSEHDEIFFPVQFAGYDIVTQGFFARETQLAISELIITDNRENQTQAQWFTTEGDEWDIQRSPNQEGADSFTFTNQKIPPDNEANIMLLEWFHDNDPSVFSLLVNYPQIADVQIAGQTLDASRARGIPVTTSQSFMELNEFDEGQRFSLFVETFAPWFDVRQVTNYYPTLNPESPFVVVNYDALNYTIQRTTGQKLAYNELWVKLKPETDQQEFIDSLRMPENDDLIDEVIAQVEVLNTYDTDVLSLGVIGLLFISFFVGLALSVVSLFTYISLTVQSRMSEFAVLRAIGLPAYRLIIIILIEQLLVLLTATGLGIIIGQFLTTQILPPLAQTAAGGNVTPPFVIITDYAAIGRYFLAIFTVLAIVLLISALWMRRTATPQALRFSEE